MITGSLQLDEAPASSKQLQKESKEVCKTGSRSVCTKAAAPVSEDGGIEMIVKGSEMQADCGEPKAHNGSDEYA
jgi:hypothetical protein